MTSNQQPTNPRSSRFTEGMAKAVEAYSASIGFDRRLAPHDIRGSLAHARALHRAGLLTDQEAELILTSLEAIGEEIERGEFPFREEYEDIHMNIEVRLRERIGEAAGQPAMAGQPAVAGKLHTARSRNDQVALDMRLFAKEAVEETLAGIKALQAALLDLAEAHLDVIMPGYTHLQRAQPVLFAHHLLAYFQMLERDRGRFADGLARADVMPLGSGALAGVPYPLDREAVAKELGFSRVSENSLDAVSDRDFLIEFEAAASLAMMHLSRLSEEIVLWSTPEFGFIELADAYATGSSIMPQKKNPDVAELARGKTGRVYGHLMALLTTMKGLPLAYNRDLQEDKEGFFDTVDTLLATLSVFPGMLATLSVNRERMEAAAGANYSLATDLADYLTKKGMPFREAHGVVGRLVRYAIERGKELSQLSLEEYRQFSSLFGEEALKLTIQDSVAARNLPGGTAPEQVKRALAEARRRVEAS